jgi:glycosyltransferase involved in cell wall biosynthesis
MRVSIGIFAHNEQGHIGRLLKSLTKQDLLKTVGDRGDFLEIITLANGCRDATAQEAERAAGFIRRVRPSISARTEVIEASGKSNAWNIYVHRFSDPLADFLIFMDADITLVGDGTLRLLIHALEQNLKANVSVDVILKDIAFKRAQSLSDRLSLAATELNQTGPAKLAGSLYCGRANILRGIWMPIGLLVEDGFLKAMVATQNFTNQENPHAIIRVQGAAHTFEAVTNPRSVFKHEVRLLIGTWMNVVLFGHLRRMVFETTETAGALIQEWNQHNPDWFTSLLRRGGRTHEFWLFTCNVIGLPIRQAFRSGLPLALIKLPVALFRCAFTTAALLSASGRIRRRIYQW